MVDPDQSNSSSRTGTPPVVLPTPVRPGSRASGSSSRASQQHAFSAAKAAQDAPYGTSKGSLGGSSSVQSLYAAAGRSRPSSASATNLTALPSMVSQTSTTSESTTMSARGLRSSSGLAKTASSGMAVSRRGSLTARPAAPLLEPINVFDFSLSNKAKLIKKKGVRAQQVQEVTKYRRRKEVLEYLSNPPGHHSLLLHDGDLSITGPQLDELMLVAGSKGGKGSAAPHSAGMTLSHLKASVCVCLCVCL
eukprot:CAMPEP_0175153130 /NCGR_PEP_ID=MMETSP0087-20121206/19542_1 /TAXON_ID=136419 /ORGANISM="Unknown Unknown, Strain D1" /LENGTH=248 /DNA_ID=CAMNT_0016439727 /DNA_START=63 /DNA_END=805 /DNA_ORIENTATION=-